MHELIPFKTKTLVFSATVLIVFFGLALIHHTLYRTESILPRSEVMTIFSWTGAVLGLIGVALSFEKPWGWLARSKLWRIAGIPPVLGEWDGRLESNYSRADALRSAARDISSERLDADSPHFIDSIPLQQVPATLTITGSLWHVKVVLVTGPAKDKHAGIRSESIVARATLEADGRVRIWYVYAAVNHDQPNGNDQKEHTGAAMLAIDKAGNAEGDYWTQRNWRKAMNTAGNMIFRSLRQAGEAAHQ